MTGPTLAAVTLCVLVLAACTAGSGLPETSSPAPPRSVDPAQGAGADLTIFGAVSLKAVLEAVESEYEAANPGTTLTVSTDSSAALETQIEQGAPADVFLSADTSNPRKLVDAGLAAGAAIAFAGNKLTIIVPADNPAGIATPADLARGGLRIIAAGDEVPITKYATQLVDNLAGQPDAPSDFAAAYTANVASKEDNVSAVVAKIALGEGDAGIVYVTDAAAADGVETIDVPDAANVPATYAGVVVGASPNEAAASAFLEWLAGPDGQAVLAEFGFLPPL